jgi:hypothetical protein
MLIADWSLSSTNDITSVSPFDEDRNVPVHDGGSTIPVSSLVYFRTGQLRRALQLTILSFMAIKVLSSGIFWQHNWMQSVVCIMAITGMTLTDVIALHMAMMLLPPPGPRRGRLRIEHVSWQDTPGAMDRCLHF